MHTIMSQKYQSTLSFPKRIIVALVIVAALVVLHSSIANASHHLDATAKSLTAIRTGPNKGFSLVGRLDSQQKIEVTARTNDFQWLMVETNGVTGWVAANTLHVNGSYKELSVSNQALSGAMQYPTVNTYSRLVGIRAYPDWDSPIQTTAWAGVDLLVIARGHYDWLYIASEFGYGWIPRSSVITTLDMSTLPFWMPEGGESSAIALLGLADDGYNDTVAGVSKAQIYRGDPQLHTMRPTGSILTPNTAVFRGPGQQYNVIGELQQRDRPVIQAVGPTGQFVFVWTNTVDGWVSVSDVQPWVNLSTLPVWSSPMRHVQTPWTTPAVTLSAMSSR